MATKQDIAMIVSMISAGYPNFSPTEATITVYYETLKDLDSELLKAATLQSIAEVGRKFAPSVGEIRGMVAELNKISSGLPTSFQAWQEVQEQIVKNGGDFGTPVWSNPVVEEAVRIMGWRNLRMSENAVSDRARFLECYEQLCTRKETVTMMLPEVKNYVEKARLSAGEEIKKLSEGMKK